MRVKLIISFTLVVLVVVLVNIVFFSVIHNQFDRLLLSLGSGLAIGMGLGYLIAHTMTSRISRLAAAANEIAAGDLTKDMDFSGDKEIVELAQAFQKMLEALRQMVGQFQKSANTLGNSAQGFSGSAQQMSAASEEIASANEHIAKSAELQVECVTKAATQIRESASSTERIAQRAHEVSDSSNTAGKTARSGGEAAAAALAKMREVFQTVESSITMVKGFSERTQRIGKIVEVITGISQQTNLLALNATIEAARAGEYGRGFAVVADEIRQLSEKTHKSAEEIVALVGAIGEESKQVITSMGAGNLEIKEGREVIDTVRASLDDIIAATVEAAKGVQEISALAEVQNSGGEEMVKTTDEISRIAENNAAATQEASAATEEMTASMEQMAASAQDLSQLAENLRQSVSGFTVKEQRGS